MTYRLLILVIFLGNAVLSFGQTCVIQSDSFVCIDDPIYFNLQITGGTAQSYSWSLNESQNSTQASPFAKYKFYGPKVITVTVNLTGGGTCTASKTIYVHPLPIANFSIESSSNFCLSKNNICVKDLSQPGPTGSPIVQRVILWGDGDASMSNNPGVNDVICHRYANEGTFTIIMEVTDNKGCIHRYTNTVKVVKDVRALYSYTITGNCDNMELCMHNMTLSDSSKLKSFYWVFGNGKVDSSHWLDVCHTYSDSGTYSPSLVVITPEGCMDTFKQNNLVIINPIRFKIVKNKYQGCLGDQFVFNDIGPAKNFYFWYSRDSSNSASVPMGEGNPFTIVGDKPGKAYISLTAIRGTCRSTFAFDSIEVFGPKAKINARNSSICQIGDTTYFCDESDYRHTKGIKILWDTRDTYCSSCTTDIQNGINLGMNCRYTNEKNPKHLYLEKGCYLAKLYLSDTITGCSDDAEKKIQIGRSDTSEFPLKYNNLEPCVGTDPSRRFYFSVPGYCGKYYINPDSALGINRFSANLDYFNYTSLSNPNGFVTVGLILESGTPQLDCPGITKGTVCRDTFWYHNWYQLNNDLNTKFSLTAKSTCNPFELTLTLLDSIDENVNELLVDWGDGQTYSATLSPTDTMKGTHFHSYSSSGTYTVMVKMNNQVGCASSTSLEISAGHRSLFKHKTDPCKGECIAFLDSVLYYGDNKLYWQDPARLSSGKESIRWEFSNGATSNTSNPTTCFNDTGYQYARLITSDSIGCIDTVSSTFYIGGPEAVIKFDKERVLCSEIVQFFDSSFVSNTSVNEFIVSYLWDFGDGKSPSYLKDPFHFYSSYGTFRVRLIVTTNRGCKDTSYKDIFVDGPRPSFEFITDSIGCVPLTVKMKNTSESVISWIWFFGDPDHHTYSTTNDSNTSFTYTTPGTYHLYLYGADSIHNPTTGNRQYCTAIYPDTSVPNQILKTVIVQPVPTVNFVTADTVCINANTAFIDNSDPKYTLYRWYIASNDSIVSGTKINPYVFTQTGIYSIRYYPTYVPGQNERACYDSAVRTVTVVDVSALFTIDPVLSTSSEKFFLNESKGAIRYEWDFGQPSSGSNNRSVLVNPSHVYYPFEGNFRVCLKAINSKGCFDTYCEDITSSIDNSIFIPNIFTPGNVNIMNDAFDILIDGEENYSLKIYNRWGEVVFEGDKDGFSNDGINWDGTYLNKGKECEAGVYYVVFNYNFRFEEAVRYTGTVTLVR